MDPAQSGLSAHYDAIAQCNRCGFCQTACPIFRSTGHEAGVARGRLALLRAIIEGRLPWSREMEEPLFDCLLCGACTANCFPAIPTDKLVVEARSLYLDKVGRKSAHRLLFDRLLPYPRRLHMAARAVALGNHAGLVEALGLLRIFGQDFSLHRQVIARMPSRPLRDELAPGEYEGSGRSLRIGYFIGCGVDLMQQSAGQATMKLLRNAARTVIVLDSCCCGLPAWAYGDLAAARKLARKNIEAAAHPKLDVIVTDCSSCASFLKKYPRLLADDPACHEKSIGIAGKVRDMVQWMAEADLPAPAFSHGGIFTYHDPCHASRGQGLRREPRSILASLPGVDYREMPEADWCCGGAGSYAFSHYRLARKVLDRKMANLKKTGADTLVTSCPACMMHLEHGIRQHGLHVRVRHLSEVVAAAYGKE
jgi:glycolate oxidase iron-sulfur subunit